MFSLAGKCLIAMPELRGTPFERAVIYICAYSDKGAMGVIINHPHPDLDLQRFLQEMADQLLDPGLNPNSYGIEDFAIGDTCLVLGGACGTGPGICTA